MTHKTKAQRQQEAIERKRAQLPRLEADLVAAQKEPGDGIFLDRWVGRATDVLLNAYLEVGHSAVEASGMVRAVQQGKKGAWIGGPVMKPTTPSQIEAVVDRVLEAVECMKRPSVLVVPHPFKTAIRVSVGERVGSGSSEQNPGQASGPSRDMETTFDVNLHILEIDNMVRALEVALEGVDVPVLHNGAVFLRQIGADQRNTSGQIARAGTHPRG